MQIRIEFCAPLLGTVAGNKEVATTFIVAKANKDRALTQDQIDAKMAEEVNTLPDELENASTLFHRDENNKPFIYSYMMNGFFKSACDAMIDSDDDSGVVFDKHTQEELKKIKLTRYSYKSTINKLIRIKERRLMLQCPGPMEFVERSLRAETMRGDRVCLARSEAAPEGTILECTIMCLNAKLWPYIEEWLGYGVFGGIGQWRTSHYGSFTWERLDVPAKQKPAKKKSS